MELNQLNHILTFNQIYLVDEKIQKVKELENICFNQMMEAEKLNKDTQTFLQEYKDLCNEINKKFLLLDYILNLVEHKKENNSLKIQKIFN